MGSESLREPHTVFIFSFWTSCMLIESHAGTTTLVMPRDIGSQCSQTVSDPGTPSFSCAGSQCSPSGLTVKTLMGGPRTQRSDGARQPLGLTGGSPFPARRPQMPEKAAPVLQSHYRASPERSQDSASDSPGALSPAFTFARLLFQGTRAPRVRLPDVLRS